MADDFPLVLLVLQIQSFKISYHTISFLPTIRLKTVMCDLIKQKYADCICDKTLFGYETKI